MLIVDKKRRHYYANLPKCGCTSVKETMASQLGVDAKDLRQRPYARPNNSQRGLQGMFGWTIVRNPFDRLVSCWTELHPPFHDKILQQNFGLLRMKKWPFAEFIQEIVKQTPEMMNEHYKPMTEQLVLNGEWIIDEAYYLERIKTAWPRMRARFGLPELRHFRKSKHKPYHEYYTDDLRRLVETRYAADLEILNYSFDGPTRKGPVACVFA